MQYIPFEDGDEWSSDIGQQAQAHMSLGERVAADEENGDEMAITMREEFE